MATVQVTADLTADELNSWFALTPAARRKIGLSADAELSITSLEKKTSPSSNADVTYKVRIGITIPDLPEVSK